MRLRCINPGEAGRVAPSVPYLELADTMCELSPLQGMDMKNPLVWAGALALAIGATSQVETKAAYTNANGTVITNGTIIISTRAAGDGHFFRQSSSTTDDMDDNRGPGYSPGDAAVGELLMDNGYSVKLLPDKALSTTNSSSSGGLCRDVFGAPNNPSLYYDGHPGPANAGAPYNELLSAMLVVISGSGSSADVAPPNTRRLPIIAGEHAILGDSATSVPGGHGELHLYSNKTASSNIGASGGLYMKVLAPNHPIMQGLPLDAQGRVQIFRDPYPDENAHVLTPGGVPNYVPSWTAVDIGAGKAVPAPGLSIIGVLDSDPNQAVFAVMEAGAGLGNTTLDAQSSWYNYTTAPTRVVHLFVNENGSSNSRRAFNALSAWGRMLFLRACQWAMGEPLQPYPALGVVDITPTSARFTNSMGMSFVRIPAGTFTMGYWQSDKLPDELILNLGQWFPDYGDYDEQPAHPVTITRPFYLGTYEVSNAEYEQFAPSHRALRGKLGFSTNDNEAVVFVSWPEAKAYCDWLSARDGQSYRLPTEAEWEFACRADTTTHFWTGDSLPAQYQKNPSDCWYPDPNRSGPTNIVPLTVGQTPPNPWGLYDMHGNVEEWCNDWYGPRAFGWRAHSTGLALRMSRRAWCGWRW